MSFTDKASEPVTIAGGGSKLFAEMVRSLDSGVGRVLKALKATRLHSNTLVIFTSDNGGERFSYMWPFSGRQWLSQDVNGLRKVKLNTY